MSLARLKFLARMGYGARGLVYLVVGGLAVLAAVGAGGETTDAKGALEELLGQPLGPVILVVLAVGLLGHAGWRFVQGALDADDHGADAKGLVIRGGLLVSALSHLALAFYAVTLVIGQRFGGGGNEGLAAWLMAQPYGRYLVAIVGAAVIGAGASQIWKGLRQSYKRHLVLGEQKMTVLSPICAFGLTARGLVFCIIGGLFVYAGVHVQPEEARGLDGALTWLRSQPAGPLLFAVIAVGLVAFGIYSFILAIWREIRHDGDSEASILPAKPTF